MDAFSLGQFLQEARETKELEIADVVAKLRIRQPILESFEAGEFEISGVPEIQVRGLLRIYARHLELDEDEVLQLYTQMRLALEKGRRGRRGRRRQRQSEAREEPFSSTQPLQEFEQADRRASGCRRLIRLLLLLVFTAVALAVIAFVTVELVGIEAFLPPSPSPEEAHVEPSATDPAAASATPFLSSPTLPAGRAQYTGAGILVSVLVTQRSWINIQGDGISVYEGIAEADTLLEHTAESEVTLSAANALALDVIWNGQRQGVLGERGQRVDIRFTVDQATITLGPGGAPTNVPPTAIVEAVEVEPVATLSEAVATLPEAVATQSEPVAPSPLPVETSVPTRLPTAIPTLTPLPTDRPRPTDAPPADPTAILPPRVTQVGLPPTKPGA